MDETPNAPQYILTQAEYLEKFKPMFEQFFTAQTIIQFAVIVPFSIPLGTNAGVSIAIDDTIICSYIFTPFSLKIPMLSGALNDSGHPMDHIKTRVEMTYITSADIDLDENSDWSPYFDVLIENLNLITLAYLIKSKDSDSHRVSREMFQPVCVARIIKPDDWSVKDAFFITHQNFVYIRDSLQPDEIEHIIGYVHVLKENLNPFMLSEEFMLTANRYFKTGFYREAVVFAQTSVETFLNLLFIELLILEGKSKSEAESIKEGLAFTAMVKREFSKRLGGQWDVDKPGTQVGKWFAHTYKLRGRIVHGGYNPTPEEVNLALYSAKDFRTHIINLIKAKKKIYAEIYKYFVVK